MAQPVWHATVGDYSERLRQYFAETYASVRRVQAEAREELERRAGGHLSSELFVGDVVLVRSDPTARREGPLRFQARVRDELYRISRKIDRHTFHVEKLTRPAEPVGFTQPIHADRLIKLDLPELPLTDTRHRVLELYDEATDTWEAWSVDRFAVDGRVRLTRNDDSGRSEWFDFSQVRYRWLIT